MNNNLDLFNKNYEQGFIDKNIYNYLVNNNMGVNYKKYDEQKISVIIPTYKRKQQLEECIKSILNQTYKNIEIIVVDDCSNENIEVYIKNRFKSDKIKVYSNQENSGAGNSRRNGYNYSTGEYIIFCDDDDYFIDYDYFDKIIEIFKNDNYSMICSNAYIYYENEKKYSFNELNIKGVIDSKEYLENFQFKYKKPLSTFTAVFRKNILENAQFSKMSMMNDSSIYLRALTKSDKVYFNKGIIGVYRIHSMNITFNIKIDFLIDNLYEKKDIYEIIKREHLIDKTDQWLIHQIELTVRYYIGCTYPNYNLVRKIFVWIRKNVKNYGFLIIRLKLYYYKCKIKKVFKHM